MKELLNYISCAAISGLLLFISLEAFKASLNAAPILPLASLTFVWMLTLGMGVLFGAVFIHALFYGWDEK